ncbi:mannitol dehydrogenase family protein [Pseudactinotalea suaedae]|uniref:mannitol dehydrogenase family protein n=1 Tax=Pseudactinotalea suaedae TaxID=1524924 RepID=UPI0012E25F17|nr:mannitol dehydrogenase family protein [Pseudactinotalea suaedae]
MSTTPIPLRSDTLAAIAERGVAVPGYDRSTVTAGIVHLGVGAFHRVHQAVYTDDLLAAGETEWGICGVGVLPQDAAMAQVLRSQDHLYTVIEKGGDDVSARVVGSIVDYLLAPEDPEAVVARIADPATRIVSLTITEGGYSVNEATGSFDPTPEVLADLEPGATPSTAFGLVVAGLARRRENGAGPLTVMSCDNLPGNGDLARLAFGAFAERLDPELGQWVRSEIAFPNTMVDRIAPVTTDADRALLLEQRGIVDGWPAVCEPFTMWVIQDRFAAGRPPWENAGATLAQDVRPYELMKLGLLNSSHQALAYFGHLLGHVYADQAAGDPDIAELVRRYLDEATPAIPRAEEMDLEGFRDELLPRFSNAAIGDTVARLAAFSSDRIPQWLVPVIRTNISEGRPVRFAAAIVASWARYAEGIDENGQPIEAVDRRWDDRHAAALAQAEDPLAFVRETSMFGSLAEKPAFTEPYLAALTALRTTGARATLQQLLAR